MDAETPQRQTRGSAAKDWLIVLVLAVLLALSAWFITKQWIAEVNRHTAELAALQESNKLATAKRNRLRELLQIDPCAIPDEVGGLSLRTINGASATKGTQGETAGAQPLQPKP